MMFGCLATAVRIFYLKIATILESFQPSIHRLEGLFQAACLACRNVREGDVRGATAPPALSKID